MNQYKRFYNDRLALAKDPPSPSIHLHPNIHDGIDSTAGLWRPRPPIWTKQQVEIIESGVQSAKVLHNKSRELVNIGISYDSPNAALFNKDGSVNHKAVQFIHDFNQSNQSSQKKPPPPPPPQLGQIYKSDHGCININPEPYLDKICHCCKQYKPNKDYFMSCASPVKALHPPSSTTCWIGGPCGLHYCIDCLLKHCPDAVPNDVITKRLKIQHFDLSFYSGLVKINSNKKQPAFHITTENFFICPYCLDVCSCKTCHQRRIQRKKNNLLDLDTIQLCKGFFYGIYTVKFLKFLKTFTEFGSEFFTKISPSNEANFSLKNGMFASSYVEQNYKDITADMRKYIVLPDKFDINVVPPVGIEGRNIFDFFFNIPTQNEKGLGKIMDEEKIRTKILVRFIGPIDTRVNGRIQSNISVIGKKIGANIPIRGVKIDVNNGAKNGTKIVQRVDPKIGQKVEIIADIKSTIKTGVKIDTVIDTKVGEKNEEKKAEKSDKKDEITGEPTNEQNEEENKESFIDPNNDPRNQLKIEPINGPKNPQNQPQNHPQNQPQNQPQSNPLPQKRLQPHYPLYPQNHPQNRQTRKMENPPQKKLPQKPQKPQKNDPQNTKTNYSLRIQRIPREDFSKRLLSPFLPQFVYSGKIPPTGSNMDDIDVSDDAEERLDENISLIIKF
jgi:hypothetical protein